MFVLRGWGADQALVWVFGVLWGGHDLDVMRVRIGVSGGCGSIDHDPLSGGVGLVGVGEDLVFVEEELPLVDAAGGTVAEDVSGGLEEFCGPGDGAGLDFEDVGDLLVGESDGALAEADGFSAEKRE